MPGESCAEFIDRRHSKGLQSRTFAPGVSSSTTYAFVPDSSPLFFLTTYAGDLSITLLHIPRRFSDMTKPSDEITVAEVNAAQQRWCDGLMTICSRYINGDNTYVDYADKFIDEMYDFNGGRVFFRPTLALAPQHFRTTRPGCRAYFLGGGGVEFPDDGSLSTNGYR